MQNPTVEEINAAISLIQSESYDKAELYLIELVHKYPEDSFSWKGISVVLFNQGKYFEALKSMQEVIRITPEDAEAQCNLGALLSELGRKDEALSYIRRAVELKPTHAQGHFNLGNNLKDLRYYHQAEQSYRTAIALSPDFSEALCNMGVLLRILLKQDQSEIFLKRALTITPFSPEANFNLGNIFHDQGNYDSAIDCYNEAIRSSGGIYPEAFCNIGISYRDSGQYINAELNIRKSLEQNPKNAEVHSNLGVILNELGRFIESEISFRDAIRLLPDSPSIRSNLLFMLSTSSNDENKVYLDEAMQYGKLVTSIASQQFNHAKPNAYPSRLRVGFLTGDFRNHPVGYFMESIAQSISPDRIEMVAFTTNLIIDDLSERLIPFFSKWQPIYGLDDFTAAKLINGMVDILVDLSGHTEYNRLPVFSYRPAPVQISWLGYWASTGVAEIDYILGDPITTPPGQDENYCEKVWRLPSTRFCYTPPKNTIGIGSPPVIQNGYVTFGSFNKYNKLTDSVISVWSKILQSVPNSRIYLKAKQFSDLSIRLETNARFNRCGVESERITYEGDTPRECYLEAFNQVDIALDPFPFPGGTTSADALWMGVPVLTLKGKSLLSRQGEGLVTCSGLVDWIANNEDDYIQKGVFYATNHDQLINLKLNLRQNVIKSKLFDSRHFAKEFEDACWSIWSSYCNQMGVDAKFIPRLDFSHMKG